MNGNANKSDSLDSLLYILRSSKSKHYYHSSASTSTTQKDVLTFSNSRHKTDPIIFKPSTTRMDLPSAAPEGNRQIREVDGPCTEVDFATYTHRKTPFMYQLRATSMTLRAVDINVYRINFGFDRSSHQQHGRLQDIEVSLANVAWNLSRLHLHLVNDKHLDGNLDGDFLYEMVHTLARMTSVPLPNPLSVQPFPWYMPVELWSFYESQPTWITPDDMQTQLHVSSFYEEDTLLNLVEVMREKVWRIMRPNEMGNGQQPTSESTKGQDSETEGTSSAVSTTSE